MAWPIEIETDLWEYLSQTKKNIVLYGMGNGADKILDVCERKGIRISGVFASDDFVRGQSFRGMKVQTFAQIRKQFPLPDLIVLVAFATKIPSVMENIFRIESECELYVPDVPAFGDTLFTRSFFTENREAVQKAYECFADKDSRLVYENILFFKLTGKLQYLRAADRIPDPISPLFVKNCRSAYIDLGAYTGDTLASFRQNNKLSQMIAFEPDRRSFKKLLSSLENTEKSRPWMAVEAGAWSAPGTLSFHAEGNRNSSLGTGKDSIPVDTVDHILHLDPGHCPEYCHFSDGYRTPDSVDWIKYDVEGSETEALEGSRKTIERFRPNLSVSIYHKSEDIFRIPLYIHENYPDYSLFIRKEPYIPSWEIRLLAQNGNQP